MACEETGNERHTRRSLRGALHEVLFEADTPAGKIFDIALIVCILCSVAVVMLESIAPVRREHGELLRALEWVFTLLFTIEYLLRIISARRPARYAKSFFGVVDLLAVLPAYLGALIPGAQYLRVIRILRVLRIFRILKLVQYVAEATVLTQALRSSRRKITVFLLTVLTLVVILGSLMYLIEDESAGFTSIPRSIYWAVVTLTTVGYGDISPQTAPGQILASLIMILGFSLIAIPTGIMSLEIARASAPRLSLRACPACGALGHDQDAAHCKHCGAKLTP